MSEEITVTLHVSLPAAWRLGAHGDPIAVFDHLWLQLHPDGSVTWERQA